MWLLTKYHKLLAHYPVFIQSIQTGLLLGTSDFLAQTIIEKRTKKTYNLKRTVDFACIGCFFLGPFLVTWYRILERVIPKNEKSGPKLTIGLKKTALDQIVCAPVGLLCFMCALNLKQGKNWEETKKEIDKKYFTILINNYKVWPAIQILNFTIMPLRYQVLLSQSAAVVWNTYLSWKTQQQTSQLE